MDKVLGDKIPEFNRKAAADEPGIASVGLGLGESRTRLEAAIIVLVAVAIVGGSELLLTIFNVPQYIMPKPSQIGVALITEWPFLWPHLVITLYELFVGFAIGGAIGFVMAAVITQFPFVEKIVTPYILLLVTTPMLALVPLLILRFGFGSEPRIIAVVLASGPMVMILPVSPGILMPPFCHCMTIGPLVDVTSKLRVAKSFCAAVTSVGCFAIATLLPAEGAMIAR